MDFAGMATDVRRCCDDRAHLYVPACPGEPIARTQAVEVAVGLRLAASGLDLMSAIVVGDGERAAGLGTRCVPGTAFAQRQRGRRVLFVMLPEQ